MSYTILVTKGVHTQLVNALEWYAEHAHGHEKKLLKAFDNALSFIEKNPLKCQLRYDDVRICFLEVYKFGIHYSLERKTIYILGFFHQHQTNENWELEQETP